MTTKFSTKVTRETDHATVKSGGKERKIIISLLPGDVVEVRLKRERRSLFIGAAKLYRHVLYLEKGGL